MSDVKETAERISTERLEAMLAGLARVTPGPWYHVKGHGEHHLGWEVGSPNDGIAACLNPETSAHIARCDPNTMGSILTELLASRHADAHEGGEVAWASCPGCNGTGDQGGNPAYGACDDCGGSGKIGTIAALNPRKETVGVKPVAWTDQYGIEYLNAGHGIDVSAERGTMGRIIPLYAAPSNPVVSDEMVERVAEAMHNCRDKEASWWVPWVETKESYRNSSRSMVRAGLAALSVNPQSGENG